MFFYMFTSVFYAIGILFSVLAAYFVVRYPKSIPAHIGAVLLLACSLGIYQAYFPNAVCLLVISVILLSAFREENRTWKNVFFTALRYVGVLAAGMVVYFLINMVVLKANGVEMISYQGGASMGQITLRQFLSAVKRCYRDFIALGNDNVLVLNATGVLRVCYWLVMGLFAVSALLLVVFEKKDWLKKAIMAAGFLALPVAMFLVYIMAPDAQTYTLMGYAVVYLLIFFAVWTDYYSRKVHCKGELRVGFTWVAEIICFVMLATYIWYGNGCYMSLEYTKNHDMAYFQTMITQIKSVEGYEDNLPVAFVGDTIEDATNTQGSLMGPVFGINGKAESNVNSFSRSHIIIEYLGFAPTICGYEETKALRELEEVKNMPSYPDDGSIQIIDNIIVVKFSD